MRKPTLKLRINMSKLLHLLAFAFVVFFAWILYAFATNGPDYYSYESWYSYSVTQGFLQRFEIGFSGIMFLCAKLGLSFQQFIMVLSALGLFIFSISVYKYCQHPVLAMVLYLFYPFVFDVVQLRNFISFAIILFGIRFLKEFTLKNALLYGLCCLLAMSMHRTALFYVFFYIAYLKEFKNVVKVTVAGAFSIVFIAILFPSWLFGFLNTVGNEIYVEGGSTIVKVLGYGAFAIVATFLMYCYHYSDSSLLKDNNEYEYLCKLVPVLLICCVAVAFASQTYRFFRNMSILLYIVFLNDGIKRKERLVLQGSAINAFNSLFAIAFAAFFFIRQISPWSPMYTNMTKVVIESNSFLFG